MPGDIRRRADDFLEEWVARLRNISYFEMARWPDWPAEPPVDLQIPPELSKYTFTVMKTMLHTGEIRIAVQLARQGFIADEVAAEGFAIAPDGRIRALSDQELRDLS